MNKTDTYEYWLLNLKNTPFETELDALKADASTLADSFYKNIDFGTGGMRGLIGLGTNRINIFTVRRATQALARYINETEGKNAGVAIAYDTRRLSDVFAKETAAVLASNGINVHMFGTPHSTPQLSFAVRELKCAAGVVITASHNPKEYNGYKIYGSDGGQLTPEACKIIAGYMDEISDMFSIKTANIDNSPYFNIISRDIDESYYKKVEALELNKEIVKAWAPRLKIVYTPLHGTGLEPVCRTLNDIGIDNLTVVDEQAKPDPDFSTVKTPNPEERQSFDLAIKLAGEIGADLILATDPDADRLGVAIRDKNGAFMLLNGNQIGCFLMDYQLSQKQPEFTGGEFVANTIVSTDMAEPIAAHYGVELRSVYTGFKYIGEQIKISEETGTGSFQFGFEESYGYLFGTFVRDKDAIQAAMKMAEVVCYYAAIGKTAYDALIDLYKKYGWYRECAISRTLKGADGAEKILRAVSFLRENPPKAIGNFKVGAIRDYLNQTRLDIKTGQAQPILMKPANVLYFELDGGRFIIRPSGTEPKLKCYLSVRAENEIFLEQRLNDLRSATEVLLDNLLV